MAVHLDDAAREAVAAAVGELRAAAGTLAVAWVAPENFHVTLKFLGGVDEARVPAIVDALGRAAARHAAFAIEVHGLGAFPSVTRARVLWAGIAVGGDALGDLAGAVDDALAAVGFPGEARVFSPHVTVGRVRVPGRAPALTSALTAAATRGLGRVQVREMALVRSDLSPRGSRYSTLAAVPLRAG